LDFCFSGGGDIIIRTVNYQQAIDYINSYTDYEKIGMPHDPAFYDLRRVDELLASLGNPHLRAKSVHIAGTNGKGSVAAMVASALSVSGYKTGLYTSPPTCIPGGSASGLTVSRSLKRGWPGW
jgi:hypothetical protein